MTQTTTGERINLVRLAHVSYKHVNIEKELEFLQDFGFTETKRVGERIYFRGYGTEPFVYVAEQATKDSFEGAAWVVESRTDLDLAVRILPGASEVYDLVDAPGGGQCVTFHDPVDGFPFHLVHGQVPVEPDNTFAELQFNFPTNKHRGVGEFQRLEKGPTKIHKMGHFGMCVTNFQKAFEFYTTKFNLKPSDVVENDVGTEISAFLHLDRGEEYVDHHSFFFFEGPKSHVHHSSFEVHDFDTQVLGHDWLRKKQYESCWGVGRHVMGSQIFDYWFDTSRFILEHYVDGDVVNCRTPTSRSKAGPDSLYVWGMYLPLYE
ncbi:Metapyrocatechase [Lachnellula occidentalis]|uniref:Metapyrocatechase n=1 Tax=Lachnellula occidentalis TaxID=215460 RepID=A0A8H8S415_9HELO|nr:Metapyrocatechase [Lachnellula occidentalis]